ncbi:MAG: TIGR00159 family protein [Candidatus Omnitrophica bacterium]|nr:TIGR00159 family protein [Candidatus Omnitrophota bacterium]
MHIFKNILFYWRPFVEIIILWYAIYHILVFFERTRARNVLRGLIVLIIIFFIFQRLGLSTLDWIMTKIFAISVIGVFILFQPELRQGLARLGGGRHTIFTSFILKEEELEVLIKQLARTAEDFSEKKIGALIALERKNSLGVYIDSGVQIDSMVSEELLESIFMHYSPLHDGGVVIVGSRIAAAACLFPLTDNTRLSRTYGTRHRAALGLSEDTDAVVIVVSEETGKISLATEGHIISDISKEELSRTLRNLLRQKR